MINGIINVYKEEGFTSHDVVAKLRGIVKQKKIGHTGTLDPDAVGVLPVCLGKATKLCDILIDTDKSYETVFRLGVVTDTQDMSGEVLAKRDVCVLDEEVRNTVMSFVGDYEQIPPMYSAKKIDGKKLYELARKGIEIERKACMVGIHDIVIKEINLPFVKMEVFCSKGTYIRTLCHDIGEKLGCGAAMETLIRTSAGGFRIEDSLTLGEIEKKCAGSELENYVISIDAMFPDYRKLIPGEKFDKALHNGNAFPMLGVCDADYVADEEKILVYDTGGQFIGVFQCVRSKGQFKPIKMFLTE